MTIGIAIPVHYRYIPYLEPLLDSISNSTTPPTEVSVSISDRPDNFDLKEYPFKLILTKKILVKIEKSRQIKKFQK